MMKKLFICLVIWSLLFPLLGRGQGESFTQEYVTDSLAPVHMDIFTLLHQSNSSGHYVSVQQSPEIKEVMHGYVLRNAERPLPGFRIRLFFDNSQTARQRAMDVESNFKAQYPDVPAYFTYQNLYFKVTVGDFRTRTDAMRFQQVISSDYPGAFIIKENINYPAL